MTLAGTIVNGHVRLDHPSDLPDGTRVLILVDEEECEHPHPMAPYDREKEIALLRESIEDAKAGRTRPVEEVMAEVAAKFDANNSSRIDERLVPHRTSSWEVSIV